MFISINGDTMVNIDLIRSIKIISTFECDVWFDSTHSIRVQGDAAEQLLRELHNRGKIVNSRESR